MSVPARFGDGEERREIRVLDDPVLIRQLIETRLPHLDRVEQGATVKGSPSSPVRMTMPVRASTVSTIPKT
ncbi:hypothetical protein GCM10025880_49520 [Methylorubrum aminovorans]|nr:hypothetical protein GCM10025880_49520 [Methylorubrum aminovorans]